MKSQARAPNILLSLDTVLELMTYGFKPILNPCVFSVCTFFLDCISQINQWVYLPLGRLLFVIELPLLNSWGSS